LGDINSFSREQLIMLLQSQQMLNQIQDKSKEGNNGGAMQGNNGV
jgi:hypothetical protein